MTKHTPSMLALLATLTAVGCGNDDKDFTIPSQEVAGTVNGASWTLVGAYAELDEADGTVRIELHEDADFDPCSYASPEGNSLFFTVPAEPGRHELSLSFSGGGQTATFYDGMGSNVIATEGVIEIDDVTDDQVAGGLNIEAGDDNAVAGMFAADRCTEE